ncbi:MAG: YebC/PmpR family DNA-binding transcriptional regulator [Chloroflexi bacterium]|nr:YebC/PmpR family DNA-binding transcriptional regulator [Chloroflexota bacterium]MCL5108875.1 YebC/PmpR family DNA-binding transcriptional regulator [Chloroflexota bacterium]
MSGHSKWAQIKRQKGAADHKRGQVFTKLGRELSIAAREGGPDSAGNPRLRLAIQHARENNMPLENIERAIKKASERSEGAALEEIVYEGYGPGGAAVMVEVLTDNRNRAAAEVRNLFTRAGGSLGESGCVAWLFDQRGLVTVELKGKLDQDQVALEAIDSGAEDVEVADGTLEVYTDPTNLEKVRQRLEQLHVPVANYEISRMAKTDVQLDEKEALSVLRLLDKLEELDDVQRVYTNVDFSPAVVEKYQG